MNFHPVQFRDTAREDVRTQVPTPEARIALVRALATKLALFPRAARRLPRFGPHARVCREQGYTVVIDVGEDDAPGPAPVAVRHVWPSPGARAGDNLSPA